MTGLELWDSTSDNNPHRQLEQVSRPEWHVYYDHVAECFEIRIIQALGDGRALAYDQDHRSILVEPFCDIPVAFRVPRELGVRWPELGARLMGAAEADDLTDEARCLEQTIRAFVRTIESHT
jgi:hypothetical protein